MNTHYTLAKNRGILTIDGKDRYSFLQGLISNDINQVSNEQAIYTSLLAPQGKFLFDFFVFTDENTLYLECEQNRMADLQTTLSRYALRADVTIQPCTEDWQVIHVWGDDALNAFELPAKTGATIPTGNGFVFVDPRLADLGARLILPTSASFTAASIEQVDYNKYDCFRLALGIPDGSLDMIIDKAIPLECNLDNLNAINWDKGCYVGQELTSRTKHRGLVRKRLLPVTFTGGTLPFQAPITLDDKEVGSMRSSCAGHGLALLRLEPVEELLQTQNSAAKLRCEDVILNVTVPTWLQLASDN